MGDDNSSIQLNICVPKDHGKNNHRKVSAKARKMTYIADKKMMIRQIISDRRQARKEQNAKYRLGVDVEEEQKFKTPKVSKTQDKTNNSSGTYVKVRTQKTKFVKPPVTKKATAADNEVPFARFLKKDEVATTTKAVVPSKNAKPQVPFARFLRKDEVATTTKAVVPSSNAKPQVPFARFLKKDEVATTTKAGAPSKNAKPQIPFARFLKKDEVATTTKAGAPSKNAKPKVPFARFLKKDEVATTTKAGAPSSNAKPSTNQRKEIEDVEDFSEVKKTWRPKSEFKDVSSTPGGRTTSLFGNNPEIPSVTRRAIRPVHEEVFSNKKFSDLSIHPHLVATLNTLGLSKLTTVQQKAVPVLLEGQDALVRSQTGSGKTLAYALPLVEMLQRVQPPITRNDGVQAVVVLPTRELALQTYEWFIKLVKPFMRLVPGCLVGGEKRKSEKARLRKGITVLVGTPGRIVDHVQHTRTLRLNRVRWLVLDEADRLLDMGYERDVASLVSALDTQSAPLLPPEAFSRNRKATDGVKNVGGTQKKGKHIKWDSDEEDEKKEEEEEEKEEEEKEEEGENSDPKKGKVWWSDSEDEGDKGKVKKVYEEEREELKVEEIGSDTEVAEAPKPKTRRVRQTILLSATLTPAVERLAGLALRSPTFIDAADVAAEAPDVVIPDSLTQCYLIAPAKLRLVTLASFFVWKCKFTNQRKMLLFCATQDMVNYLTEMLTIILTKKEENEDSDDDSDHLLAVEIDFFRLHGDMDQKERTLVFQTFRDAKSGVLLCTDVAARGLDLPHVDWIVQYTAPTSVSDYVHRVGRTARVGAAGSALLFLTPSEVEFVRILQDRRICLQEEKLDRCLEKLALASTSSSGRQKPSSSVEAAASALQLRFELALLRRKDLHDLACKAYISYVRFYASYPREMRSVFNFKEQHLGHHAKSFALREAPKTIAGIGRRQFQLKSQNAAGKPKKRHDGERRKPQGVVYHDHKRERELVVSEFSSGLQPAKKKQKL